MQAIEYKVTPIDPKAHLFRVVLAAELTDQTAGSVRLFLPAWIPGSYVIRDFARHVVSIEARQNDAALPLQSVDRQSWICEAAPGRIEVTCHVYARDESVRAAFLDELRGFFNPTSLCLRVAGLESAPCHVHIDMPPEYGSWQVVTMLTATRVEANGFGSYSATDYWDLIDHPVAMGRSVRRVRFNVAGVPHAFVLLGPVNDVDTQRLSEDLAAICDTQAAVFGELPVDEYLFMAQITSQGYGGIEHRDCSVLQVARGALPRPHETERSAAYETLLGLCSHEYFHLWNVKRIRPAAVAASDLTSEAYFRDLWAYEGITSYYDDLALVRAGVLSVDRYLQRLARVATRIEQTPGQARQSLAQSSFDAWLKFYRPDENTPNAVVSYYGKGALLALALDLKLRHDTAGKISLDDVMIAVWDRHGEPEEPVPDGELEAIAAEVSGLDLTAFFDQYVRTTVAIPCVDLLQSFGITTHFEPADDDASVLLGRLGVTLDADASVNRVRHVHDDSPAQRSGISPGDRLVAFNGIDPGDQPAAHVRRVGPGEVLRLHLFREDALVVRDVTTGKSAAGRWQFTIDDAADEAAAERRDEWLDVF